MSNNYHIRAQTVLALILILLFVLVAIFAEVIAPTTGELVDGVQLAGKSRDQLPHPPSPEALLGTTPGQMDIFYALVHGTRNALIFGLITTLLTALIGLIVGTVGGMSGGLVNQLSMRFTDGILCFPVIAGIVFFQQIINMTIISLSGDTLALASYDSDYLSRFLPSFIDLVNSKANFTSFILNFDPVMLALVVLCWVPYARMMNVLILQTIKMEYVSAALSAGAKGWRIFFRHILPNTGAPLIVLISKDIGQMVIWQTTFAFVGFQSMSTWAAPLIVSRSWILGMGGNPFQFWWVYLPITLAIILFAFAWNLLGDEINHWLNPKKT
jgi:peptide/nickel transport system permease protein